MSPSTPTSTGITNDDELETIKCNLCGSNDLAALYTTPDLRFGTDGLFTVVECRVCGLGFVNPRPRIERMALRYPAIFFDRFESTDQSRRYAEEARYLQEIVGATGERTLLDVGCATGGFLRYMKKLGWQVEGVEPIYTGPMQDFVVHSEQVFDINGLEGRFDAVTAWAVLEHVHDPSSYFRAMSAALRPGGRLIVQVPNLDSISSRKLFREDVPRHIYFYSKRAMLRYMSENNLTVTKIDCRDNVYEMSAVGFLTWLCYRSAGKRYEYSDVPIHFADYCRARGLPSGPISLLRYLCSHPLSAMDKALAPVVDRAQMLLGVYGQVTYVATKNRQ